MCNLFVYFVDCFLWSRFSHSKGNVPIVRSCVQSSTVQAQKFSMFLCMYKIKFYQFHHSPHTHICHLQYTPWINEQLNFLILFLSFTLYLSFIHNWKRQMIWFKACQNYVNEIQYTFVTITRIFRIRPLISRDGGNIEKWS